MSACQHTGESLIEVEIFTFGQEGYTICTEAALGSTTRDLLPKEEKEIPRSKSAHSPVPVTA